MEDCSDEKLCLDAKRQLCVSYSLTGRKDEALKLAETLPGFYDCREFTIEYILQDESDKLERSKYNQSNIILLIERLVGRLIYLSSNGYMGERLSVEEKIKFAEAALQIYSAVFYEGHTAKSSGAFRHIYERLSELYCRLGDTTKAIEMLRLAAESAIAYDKQIDSDEKYTSMFVCDIKCSHKDYSDTVRLLQLMDQRKSFDAIRECNEYKDIKLLLETNS